MLVRGDCYSAIWKRDSERISMSFMPVVDDTSGYFIDITGDSDFVIMELDGNVDGFMLGCLFWIGFACGNY